MTRFKLIRTRNALLFSNLIANIIGVSVVAILNSGSSSVETEEVSRLIRVPHAVFMFFAFAVPFVLTILYERPIRRYLGIIYKEKPVPDGLIMEARRKLLNEPFFLIALDLGIWFSAAAFFPLLFWIFDAGIDVIRQAFFVSFYTGLITTTVAFFVFEFVMQRQVVPVFFPEGGLYKLQGTIRIRIRTRLIAFLFACNLIPLISILLDLYHVSHSKGDPALVLRDLQSSIYPRAFIFIAVGVWVSFLVSSNLTRPLQQIIEVLRRIRKGDFEGKVAVTSNDEIGFTGDAINEMTEGLKERDFIKDTFGKYVTREIRDEILSGEISLDGEVKEVTMLFADLRDFTRMVEMTAPKEVVKTINSYFKEMEEAIRNYSGLVVQYIGDEIEAVFGAPLFREDHPELAVQAALEMKQRLHIVNRRLEERGQPPLSHGIGIHTGEVLAANIGSPNRLSYALVGDTVNTASRLQGLNKEFGTEIIISEATKKLLKGKYNMKALPAARLKGKKDPTEIYSLG